MLASKPASAPVDPLSSSASPPASVPESHPGRPSRRCWIPSCFRCWILSCFRCWTYESRFPLLDPELLPLLEELEPPPLLDPPSLGAGRHTAVQAVHWVTAFEAAVVHSMEGAGQAAASAPSGQPQANEAAHAELTATSSVLHKLERHFTHVPPIVPPFGQFVTV